MAQAAKTSSQIKSKRPICIDLTDRKYSSNSESWMYEETPLGYFDEMGRRVYLRSHNAEVAKARSSQDALIRLAKQVSGHSGPFVVCGGVVK